MSINWKWVGISLAALAALLIVCEVFSPPHWLAFIAGLILGWTVVARVVDF